MIAKAGDFNFGTKLGFVKAHDEMSHRRKSGLDMVLYYRSFPKFCGFSFIFVQRLKLAISNLACGWVSLRPTIISSVMAERPREA